MDGIAANPHRLEGKSASDFLSIGAVAADSAMLGGMPPNAFLGRSETAANASPLDGRASNSSLHAVAASPASKATRVVSGSVDASGNVVAGRGFIVSRVGAVYDLASTRPSRRLRASSPRPPMSCGSSRARTARRAAALAASRPCRLRRRRVGSALSRLGRSLRRASVVTPLPARHARAPTRAAPARRPPVEYQRLPLKLIRPSAYVCSGLLVREGRCDFSPQRL